MSREHKFRGKRIDNGEWVYGYYYHSTINGRDYIADYVETRSEEVDPETVGEYTGLHDKNGVEICQDDIVKVHDFSEHIGVIKFGKHKTNDMSNTYECGNLGFYIEFNDEFHLLRQDIYFWHGLGIEVIGNIWDNPKLEVVE